MTSPIFSVWLFFTVIVSIYYICLANNDDSSISVSSKVAGSAASNARNGDEDTKKSTTTTPKSISIDLDNMSPETLKRIPNKTRIIFYEYNFNATTFLYVPKSGKQNGIKTVVKAKYQFDILHHDIKGNILARYRFLKCISGPCGYRIPDIYVDFVQGGNNLEGLYMKLEDGEKPHWNPLLAILHSVNTPAISGAGDEQNVVTPYGLCHYIFSRPRDKRFRRRLNHCSMDGIHNHTLIPGISIQQYEQDIMYYQNTKVDADIVFIDVEEKMMLSSTFDEQWNLQLDVESHMEMMNRTMKYLKRVCPYEITAEHCASNIFNATKIGSNWVEIMKTLQNDKIHQIPQLPELLNKYKALSSNTASSTKPDLQPKLFTEIVNTIQLYSEDILDKNVKAVINAQNNADNEDEISTVLVDALATAGTVQAHNVVLRVFTSKQHKLLQRYLQTLVWTTNLNKAVIKNLQQWYDKCHGDDEGREICQQVGYTLASLLRRHCHSSVSQNNACNKGKDQIVNKFLDKLMDCSDISCHEDSLNILLNLPIETSLHYVRNFICSKENGTKQAQRIALKLLAELPTEKISGKVLKKVMQVFRNSCPLPQSTTDQTLASEVLLNAVPEHTAVGTFLLRMESTCPSNHEKWAFFYDNMAIRRSASEIVDEYWSQLRRFRVFRPNYAQRSLLALSNVFQLIISESKHQELSAVSKTEFNSAVFKRSEMNIYKSTKRSRSHLFGLDINTEGLESVASGDSESSDDSEPENSEELEAVVQFALFGSREVPIKLFTGYSQLMSAVWNANGDRFNVLDRNLVARQYHAEIPLLSGLTADIQHDASVHVHIDGAVSVSLWNKNADASLNANISAVLAASVNLLSNNEKYSELSLQTALSGSVTTNITADFYVEPHSFCMVVGQGPTRFTHIYSLTEPGSSKGKTLSRTRYVDGSCFALNRAVMKMCK